MLEDEIFEDALNILKLKLTREDYGYKALSIERLRYREMMTDKEKIILDACCGSRMFHFNKKNPNVIFMDNRDIEDTLCDGRKLKVHPDIVSDFRDMPFKDDTFYLVIFDPPHLLKVGEKSWLCKKYGKLQKTWASDIKKGFDECMRVLKPNGTLIFKWATRDIKFKQILDVIETRPIIFHKNNNTFFLVFMKGI